MNNKLFFPTLALLLISTVFLGSCKEKEKTYTCDCPKPGGGADSFTIYDTQTDAEFKCAEIFEKKEETQAGYYEYCNLHNN